MAQIIQTAEKIALDAVSNVLQRKRKEHLAEIIKVDNILAECKATKSSPAKGYSDELNQLKHQITTLEKVIEVLGK